MAARAPLFTHALASLATGTIISLVISHRPLKAFREIMETTNQIAGGDYSVRLRPTGPEELRDLVQKFNHMA